MIRGILNRVVVLPDIYPSPLGTNHTLTAAVSKRTVKPSQTSVKEEMLQIYMGRFFLSGNSKNNPPVSSQVDCYSYAFFLVTGDGIPLVTGTENMSDRLNFIFLPLTFAKIHEKYATENPELK